MLGRTLNYLNDQLLISTMVALTDVLRVMTHPRVFLLEYGDFCGWVWKQLHSLPEARNGTERKVNDVLHVLNLQVSKIKKVTFFMGSYFLHVMW